MAEKVTQEGKAERGSRLLRNVHLLGALALEGAAVLIPPLAVPLTAFAGVEAIHGGAWELVRQNRKNKRLRQAKA